LKKKFHISLSHLHLDVDPVKAWNYQHFLVLQLISETLVKSTEGDKIIPGIAKSWEITDGGRKVIFSIDPKAKFHDGSEVKARDVAISYSRHFLENSKSVVAPYLRDILKFNTKVVKKGEIIDGIKILDEKTISFELKGPYAPFLSVLSMPGFSIFKSDEDFDDKSTIVGLGAYKIEINRAKKLLVLTRNEDYYQDLPQTKVFCVTELSNLNDILSSLYSKKLDLAFGTPLRDLHLVKLDEDIHIHKTNTIVTLHSFINPQGELNNADVRRELSHFISTFHQINHDPLHTPINTFIPEGFFPSSYYQRPYRKISRPVFEKKIRLYLHENYFSQNYVDKLKEFISASGVKIEVKEMNPNELYSSLDKKDFDVIVIPYMANFPDPDGFLELLTPGQVFEENLLLIKKFFESISNVRFWVDPQKRLEEYSHIFSEFENQHLIIPMSQVTLPLIHTKRLRLPDINYKYEADLRKIFNLSFSG
jgi:ABC-type transport system substrate-binding protein